MDKLRTIIRDNLLVRTVLMLAALAAFMCCCMNLTGETIRTPAVVMLVPIILIAIFLFRDSLKFSEALWLINGGVFVKFCYVVYTAVWARQHDVIDFGAGEGHAAYIEYILNNRHLPDMDPTTLWGFFQPPLHHSISAVWMWLGIRLKLPERQIQESVQVLTLAYMCIVMVVTYLIARELELSKRAETIAVMLVSFHPIFVMLSGSINNDALALCLSVIALYLAICWYKKPGYMMTVLLAASVGLSMMAKLSSALVAPGIGIMMLYKVWSEMKQEGSTGPVIFRYIPKFALLGVISGFLGLWWPIRNLIRWNMPINYIPKVGEQLEHTGFFSRVLDIRTSSVFPVLISGGGAYDEYNVPLAMMKTSLYGEYDFAAGNRWIMPVAIIVFVCAIVLAIAAFIATWKCCMSSESSLKVEYRILLGVTYISFLAGYLAFALGYSNFSAQDFRYAAIIIVIEALFLGIWSDESKIYKAVKVVTGVGAAASAAMFLMLGWV